MTEYKMKYGRGEVSFSFDEKNVLGVIVPNEVEETDLDAEALIRNAIANPIESKHLEELVHPGDKVCIAIGDKTRLWQKQSVMLKVVVEILNGQGVKDEDITIISAVGSHPFQTREELLAAVGEELFERIRVVEHDCKDEANLVYVGTTKRGTEVSINKIAHDADCLILLGGIVYHYLAGYGGGRKTILPGLSSHKTIMQNHAWALNPHLGEGSNPAVKNSVMDETNPLADDMLDAAKLVEPDFIVNVIANDDGKLTHAVAGHYIAAHEAGAAIIDRRDGVEIKELADMVIVNGGGYPKDINMYQSIKPMVNASAAVEPGGIILLANEASNGIGSPDLEYMLKNFDNTADREKYLRENYTIGKNVAYSLCEYADLYQYILVSSLPQEAVEKTNIHLVRTMEEALEMAYAFYGSKDIPTYLMPYGANTFPKLKP